MLIRNRLYEADTLRGSDAHGCVPGSPVPEKVSAQGSEVGKMSLRSERLGTRVHVLAVDEHDADLSA